MVKIRKKLLEEIIGIAVYLKIGSLKITDLLSERVLVEVIRMVL